MSDSLLGTAADSVPCDGQDDLIISKSLLDNSNKTWLAEFSKHQAGRIRLDFSGEDLSENINK